MGTFEDKGHAVLLTEMVLCQGEAAKKAHKSLFFFDDACYVPVAGDMIGSVLSSVHENLNKLHISAGWEAILKVALWASGEPGTHDVLNLLKKAGITDDELAPFRKSDIHDILPWLYYGKRFDVLRRICNTAKAKAESKVDRKKLIVYCHLVSDEADRIVASSL